MFKGFPEETIRFFLDLRFHNEISFYKAHEDEYLQYVKEPFFSFIEALAPTMSGISQDMEVRPAKCLARIRRDTRFTKDKSPFRDHLWLLFRRSGESKDNAVMYWFELSPDEMNWGVGFWGENRPAMNALRDHILRRPSEILTVLEDCGLPDTELELAGDCFTRMKIPDQVPEPLRSFYPRKSLYVKRVNAPFALAYQKELVDRVAEDFVRLKPLYFLFRNLADEGAAKLDA